LPTPACAGPAPRPAVWPRRAAAFAALADAEACRDDARRARAAAIAGLDARLDQFAQAAAARGCAIHWAETAADARRIITGIARERNIRLAVKSKSMATEEVELNAALRKRACAWSRPISAVRRAAGG
jgi:L-lactate dehydrogenase complex protein LldF